MKKRKKMNVWLAMSMFLLLIVSTAAGRTIYVDDDATGLNDGSRWADAYNYLQDALADANSGDEIRVAQGTYKPDQGAGIMPGDRTATFQLINGVTLKGGYAGLGEPDPNARDIDLYETILSGDLNGNDGPNFANNDENSYHVVTGSRTNETVVLDGFTISGGNANGSGSNDDGGGMYNSIGNPTVLNCTFSGNRAYDDGGGMYNRSGSSPILVNCIFSGNSAGGKGGGMRNYKSSPTLINCTFSNNNSTDSVGGGMSNSDSSPTLTNCTFSGNRAWGDGGGMDSHKTVTGQTPCNPTLTDCTFIENAAGIFGGGMNSCDGASATLTNCIFSGNSAEYDGGGMYNIHTDLTLTNCIFSGNSSDKGGGMYNWNSSPTLTGCTFSGNSADGGGAIWNQRDSNPTLTSCILWGNTAMQGDNIYLALYHWAGQTFTAGINVSYSDVQGGEAGVHVETGCTLNWGEGNINANPLLALDGYHLGAYSPCINAGDPLYTPSFGETDIDGEPRVMGGRVDMGIDEFTSTPTPFIGISPTELMFYATQGGSNPKSQILSIRNIGSGTLNWEIDEDCPWLQVYPPNGESTGQINEVTLSVDISGLDPCVHDCQLTITGNEAANSPQMAAITLYLGVVLRVPSEYTTIQAAIDAAKDGDTVLVADGIYSGDGNRDLNFGGKVITVSSENGPDTCIIDCNGTEDDPHRGFYFHSGEDCNSVVAGFTITNGYARFGGGIYCSGSSPTLINCTFSGNKAEYSGGWPWPRRGEGGGIYCDDSSPTITNCTFSGNLADNNGGGMYNDSSSPIVTNCTFSGNSADSGGGMVNHSQSSPTLINCDFSANHATYGGAIHNRNESDPILSHCTFKANTASNYGGAIVNEYHSAPILDYCTFVANTAHSGGGAIKSEQENTLVLINNCIFAGNSARWGGAILNDDCDQVLTGCIFTGNIARTQYSGVIDNDENRVVLTNCIFWNNLDMHGQITINPFGGSADKMAVNYCCVQGWTGQFDGTGNIDADPCFAELGYWDANSTPEDANDDFWIDGDYHLLADSPCIDAGDPNYMAEPNETDLDGKPRVIGGRIDMGAYETPVPAEVRIIPRGINLASKGKWITCYIWLPEEYHVADIDPNSVLLEDEIEPESLKIDEQQQIAVARFSRSEVQGILNAGQVEITISGELKDGARFEGNDIIRVIDRGKAGTPTPDRDIRGQATTFGDRR